MTAALAIFVKTPGLSPVKTRLAAGIGAPAAQRFHELAAAATAEVARACVPWLKPYWAIAEAGPAAVAAWPDFASLHQGQGDLGERLHTVYARLQARHGRVLLIGADAPQLAVASLRDALTALDDPDTPCVLGAATDGGFWLFGGRVPIAREVWCGIRYSHPDTAMQLQAALQPLGANATLPALTDVDEATDLDALEAALTALPMRLPAQDELLHWMAARREPIDIA